MKRIRQVMDYMDVLYGIENPLFFKENTRMLFGDARETLDGVLKALQG